MSRVAIVEDHVLLAESLAAALQRNGIDARIVTASTSSTADTAEGIVTEVLGEAVDLVLLDLDLGELGDSTELIPELVSAGVRVLVVTGAVDPMRIAAALDAGAIGYQAKAAGLEALLARVQAALAATAPLDAEHRVALLEDLRRQRLDRKTRLAPFARLTDREAQTLQALGRGSTVTTIAADWCVSEATLRSHVRGILGKLGVSSQLGAVALALRTGWLSDRPPVE